MIEPCSFTVEEMSAPAVADLAARLGGMVMSVVMAVEIATPDGERHSVALWDHESSMALQLGLEKILGIVMKARAQAFCEVAFETGDEEDDNG